MTDHVSACRCIWCASDPGKVTDRLAAAIERVRELHVPYTTGVLTGDCAAEACDHEDDCPTQKLEYCAGCDEIAEAADCYYMERDARLTAYPCPTIRALNGSPEADTDPDLTDLARLDGVSQA